MTCGDRRPLGGGHNQALALERVFPGMGQAGCGQPKRRVCSSGGGIWVWGRSLRGDGVATWPNTAESEPGVTGIISLNSLN